MKNKLFLTFVMLLLVFPIVNAVTCKTIGPVGAANGTDVNILEGENAAARGSETHIISGVSSNGLDFWRGMIILNSTINLTTGGETIPPGVTITNMTFNFTVSEWKGGCAVFENVSMYPLSFVANESTKGIDSTWTNGTDWESFIGTFTAGSPDTLSRTTLLSSSTGSSIDWSSGGDVTVFCTTSSKTLNDLINLLLIEKSYISCI